MFRSTVFKLILFMGYCISFFFTVFKRTVMFDDVKDNVLSRLLWLKFFHYYQSIKMYLF